MLTEQARALTRGVVEPVAHALGYLGFTPNMLTLIGTLLHLVVAWLLAAGSFLIGGLLLFVSAGVDGLDGALARKTGRTTALGAFLDSTFDRMSEMLVFLGLVVYAERALAAGDVPPFSPTLAYLAMAGSLMVSYARARAEGIGLGTRAGIFGRLERMVVVWLGLITGQVAPALWIVAAGAWLTTALRVYDVWRQCLSTPAGRDN